MRRARAVLSDAADLEQAARGRSLPFQGLLRVGVIPTVAPYLLPRALPAVRRAHPGLRLRLHEAQTADLVRAARDGELDLLLLALGAELGGLATHALFRDPFVAVFPAGHRLAGRKSIREDELDAEEILLLGDGHCLRKQVLGVCAAAAGVEREEFRATSLPTLVQMVAGGVGATLLPSLAVRVEQRSHGIAVVPFRKPAPARTIGLAWRPSSPHAAAFRSLGVLLTPPDAV